jgi:PAS domain S-box-containing protein
MKLQTQFTLAFVPLLVLAGIGTTVTARKAVHKAIVEEMGDRGGAVLSEIASRIPPLEKSRERDLLPLLTAALTREGASYVMVLDPTGNVVAHTDIIEKGKHYTDAVTAEALTAHTPMIHEIRGNPQPLLDVSIPVWGPEDTGTSDELLLLGVEGKARVRRGTLRMALPLARALDTERRISRRLALLLALADALLLGLIFFLMQGILRPVKQLVQATQDISQGMYGALVPIPAAAELADFASHFNQMSDVLARTTISKEFLHTILENIRDPMIVLDPTRRIQTINQAVTKLLGYQAQDIQGQPIDKICDRTGQTPASEIQGGYVQPQPAQFLRKQGDRITVRTSEVSFKDKENKDKGFIIVLEP